MAQGPRNSGFTLIEAIMLMVIVGIVGLASGIGLQAFAKTPTQTNQPLALNAECVSRMEQMRATDFASLSTKASTLSGNVTINGTAYTCSVAVANADADGDGTVDADFAQITVTIGGRSLTCYVMQP